MSPDRHPLDLLLDLLDDRLPAEARRDVEAHVRACPACQHELAALTAARRAVRTLTPPPLPHGLDARIFDAIDADDATSATSATSATGATGATDAANRQAEASRGSEAPPSEAGRAPAAVPRLPWVALAGLAAVLVLAAVLWWRPSGDLPDAAAAHVRAEAARQLALTNDATAAEAVQAYFTQRVTFPVRVFDLGMMGYTIAGAGVLDLDGRTAAAWIYRSDAGWLLCEMFLASIDDLPPAEETRTANDIVFHIYHRDGGTQVFWAEGDVLCVLASTLPADAVVQLALAKAMKP